jgi:putative ABC transport system permease protein
MNPISLTPIDIAIASSLILLDAVLSLLLRLRLHVQILIAAARMVVQLVAIGYVLRFVFSLDNPVATLALVLVMIAVAGREVAARPEHRLRGHAHLAIGISSVGFAHPRHGAAGVDHRHPAAAMVPAAIRHPARRHHPRQCAQLG